MFLYRKKLKTKTKSSYLELLIRTPVSQMYFCWAKNLSKIKRFCIQKEIDELAAPVLSEGTVNTYRIYNHVCIYFLPDFWLLEGLCRLMMQYKRNSFPISWTSLLPRIYNVNIAFHKRSFVCIFEKDCGRVLSRPQQQMQCAMDK